MMIKSVHLLILCIIFSFLSACTTAPVSEDAQIPVEEVLLPESQTSPAVKNLLKQAREAARSGDLQKAESLLERTVRIEPRNATLWNYMAKLRLEQKRFKEAAGLASKSNSLAGDNKKLVSDNWQIIAHARYNIGDIQGARQAQSAADRMRQK